ncbi:hypothetical protein BH18ACT4_BH18ACT4_00200 [soil metagenome]
MNGDLGSPGRADATHGTILPPGQAAPSGRPGRRRPEPAIGCPIADDTGPEGVLAANRAFYAAFEARDLDAMSAIWEHSDRVVCTHPGWRMLRGWGAVSGSWFALFGGPQHLQFILTNEAVTVNGDTAWVTIDENLLGESVGATVAAVNLFVRAGPAWKLVLHHGSPVATNDLVGGDDVPGEAQ